MENHTGILLSTAYLPPVQYVSKFLLGPVFIENHENYQKQSYRNRCCIYGANGRLCLVIPLKKRHGEKTPVSAIEIDYNYSWQRIHLKSIESAYRLSAFYEYYADEFRTHFEQETRLLMNWNLKLLGMLLHWIGIPEEPLLTSAWVGNPPDCTDLRRDIHPKSQKGRHDAQFSPIPYSQVFKERHGFIPNLSIIDLIFNEGPEAISVLRKSLIPPAAA